MNMKSRVLFLAIAFVMMVVFIPLHNVQAQGKFSDVPDKAFYAEPVKELARQGVISGYEDGTFKPNKEVNRAEAATMIAKAIGLDTKNAPAPNFTDVKKGAWYSGSISSLVKAGIVDGYPDGTFLPEQTITRAALAKMLVEAYAQLDEVKNQRTAFKDVVPNSWYEGYVTGLVNAKITTGKTPTTFAPNAVVTRGEAATFLYRAQLLRGPAPEIVEIF
ncbi:S-layer homology domain-containing protein [Anaerobacillus sp. MEB173]|uniref:S-layer homology domain-containing protein n=1 Tax=Anaerobacillus sp. MEB173 TaxID=3383345 RepID=UPI003F8ECAC2